MNGTRLDCQAKWWCGSFGPPEPCDNEATLIVGGKLLCFTHGATVEAGHATLDEVMAGERSSDPIRAEQHCNDLTERFG